MTDAEVMDADGDGRRLIYLYDFGPGDTVRIPTQILVTRGADGRLHLRSDARVELQVGT